MAIIELLKRNKSKIKPILPRKTATKSNLLKNEGKTPKAMTKQLKPRSVTINTINPIDKVDEFNNTIILTNPCSEVNQIQESPGNPPQRQDLGQRKQLVHELVPASGEPSDIEKAVPIEVTDSINLSDLSLISEGDFVCEDDHLRFYYANCRGFSSKKESITQIVNDLNCDIAILTETNFKGPMHPRIPNFCTFFRNRELLSMGGVSILVKEKFKNYCVKSKSGVGANEFITVKINCFEPKLAVIAVYGSQKSEGAGVVESNVHELFFEVKECQAAGYSVILVGDTNIQLGREVIHNNDMIVSKAGSIFNDYIKECGLQAANNLSPDPATFIKGDLRRVLDVVLVEDSSKVLEFKTDSSDKQFTPFTVKTFKGGKTSRVYADHQAISWSMNMRMSKPDSKLPPSWRYNRQLGDQKFDVLTDAGAECLIDMCDDEENVDTIVKKLDKFMEKSKFTAYGKRTMTRKKKEKWDEKRMWAARFDLVKKLAREFEKDKDNIKVWRARKIAMGPSDNQTTSLKDYRTGKMIEDLEEMTDMLLEYNKETMAKEVATPEAELLRGMKEDVIEELMEDVSEFPQSISWETFMKVTDKVMKQKKGVLRDFIKSGPAFKCAVFVILNKIYRNEMIPEIFKKTLLTKLWKRKGSIGDLANHRFIHGRHWLGKLFEKCLVDMISEEQVRATPDFQLGGIPGKSTREHLLAAMLIIKSYNAKGKSVPLLLCDIRKCFDKLVLTDMIYDCAVTGADLKAVKMLKMFHEDFEIVMAGDVSEKPNSRKIPNTAGQGTNAAPGWAGNSQAQTVEKNVDIKLCAKIGDTQTGPHAFVDDIMVAPAGAVQARKMGPQLTKAFDELSIKIHEDKTVLVIPGETMAARKMRDDLTSDPMKVQGHPIKIVEKDAYLGMVIHQGGVKASVEATFNQRKGKAWGKVPVIKSLISHPQLLN